MVPPATHESGHFYFAQTGHSHFAATLNLPCLSKLRLHRKVGRLIQNGNCRKSNAYTPEAHEESKKTATPGQAGEAETINAGPMVRKARCRPGQIARPERVPLGPRANASIAANVPHRRGLRSFGSPRKRERCQVRGRDGRPAFAGCFSFPDRPG